MPLVGSRYAIMELYGSEWEGLFKYQNIYLHHIVEPVIFECRMPLKHCAAWLEARIYYGL